MLPLCPHKEFPYHTKPYIGQVGQVASPLKLCNSLVYALNYKPYSSVITYLAAPSQAPGNIEWNLTNSKIFLNWEHVKAMENESEVTGYKVSLSE